MRAEDEHAKVDSPRLPQRQAVTLAHVRAEKSSAHADGGPRSVLAVPPGGGLRSGFASPGHGLRGVSACRSGSVQLRELGAQLTNLILKQIYRIVVDLQEASGSGLRES